MNGRAYDPEIGRFTGVDPFISGPLNSQALNPYSYVSNNPLAGTDPTGYTEDCAEQDKQLCQPEEPKEEEKKEDITNKKVEKAAVDRKGNLYVTTADGTYKVDKVTNKSNGREVSGQEIGNRINAAASKVGALSQRTNGGDQGSGNTNPVLSGLSNAVSNLWQNTKDAAATVAAIPENIGGYFENISDAHHAAQRGDTKQQYESARLAGENMDDALKGTLIVAATVATAGELTVFRSASAPTLSFATRAEVRAALGGDLGAAANSFFKGATSKSTNFKIIDLDSGAKRFEFFSPARNAGYGKLYVQEVSSGGQIIREFKDTIGPQGLIERKWVHGG